MRRPPRPRGKPPGRLVFIEPSAPSRTIRPGCVLAWCKADSRLCWKGRSKRQEHRTAGAADYARERTGSDIHTAMTHDDGFVEYICELLLPLGQAQGRPMFGGYGVYLDGLMIGLVIDGGCFLKADDLSKHEFLKAGCEPFVYHGQEKPITMNYWTVPAEALESEREMERW